MKKVLFFLFIYLFLSQEEKIYSQSPTIQWQKSLGGSGNEEANAIQQTSDGGYIVAGTSNSNDGQVTGNHGLNDYWIVKLDASGNIQWQKSLGGSDDDVAWDIKQTSDGGYIVAGNTFSTVLGNYSGCWIVKLDASGNIQWQQNSGAGADAHAIQQTSDGGYIVAGSGNSNIIDNHGNNDFWIMKLDNAGKFQWQKSMGGSDDDEAYAIQQTSDNGYIVSGFTSSKDGDVSGNYGGYHDYWVVKLDSKATIQWQKCLGGSDDEQLYSILQSKDGGYLVPGFSFSTDGNVSGNHGNADYWIVKLDIAGNIAWQKSLGGSDYDWAYSAKQTTDGGYIVGGFSNSNDGDVTCNHGTLDDWIVKIDGTGNIQWQKSLGGSDVEDAQSVLQSSDGGYVIAGSSLSNDGDVSGNHGNQDIWIVKLGKPPPIPSINITASSISVCNSSPVTFTALVKNNRSTLIYQWKKNNISVGTDTSVYIDSTLINNDSVVCELLSTEFCVINPVAISDTIVMNGHDNPTITIVANDSVICAGTFVSFTASGNNIGLKPEYQWQKNGNNVGTNSPLFISNALNNKDQVTCILTNNATCLAIPSDTSNIITITVSPAITPSLSITALANDFCFGNPVTFTAIPTNGGVSPSYQWKINGNDVGGNDSVYSNNSLTNGSIVSCLLTSSIGCTMPVTSTNTITMSIYPLPLVTDGTDKVIQLGTSISLELPVIGDIATYLWTPPDGLNNPAAKSPIATPTINTTYQLQVTSVNGCTASGEIKIDVFTQLLMPDAFTPNGDGKNDVFRIPPSISVSIKYLTIYDRWGNQLFKTSDPTIGWDGTYLGQQQPTGAYVWMLEYIDPLKNEVKQLKGTITLIR
jgi:gliding motility-associated-like protein